MIRLHVTAEGQTEQAFVKQVLSPYLAAFEVYADARCVLTSKDKRASKEYRGGLIRYEKAKMDIQAWLKEDSHAECRFTTMFDLYALPDDFPAYAEAKRQHDPYERIRILEQALGADIDDPRFVPYIQLHEFEALIFADPKQLDCEYLEHDGPIQNLISMVGDQNPELINDSPQTAPSKRILKEIPEYDKVSAGVSVAGEIGLQALRNKCRHFNDWLTGLEQLSVS
ncbi:MAG: DUF4276 family protein [Pontiellaceae bacterium]|nr:DUF4276 family protein [Pontiellaceae bacterium]